MAFGCEGQHIGPHMVEPIRFGLCKEEGGHNLVAFALVGLGGVHGGGRAGTGLDVFWSMVASGNV